MNARTTLARIIERVFPKRVARIRETNRARQTAMQLMLSANRKMRMNGWNVERINDELGHAMRYYRRGSYKMCILCFPAE